MAEVQTLSVEEVAAGCRKESRRRGADTGFCYELVRRALDEGPQPAWSGIERAYRRMLCAGIAARAADLRPSRSRSGRSHGLTGTPPESSGAVPSLWATAADGNASRAVSTASASRGDTGRIF